MYISGTLTWVPDGADSTSVRAGNVAAAPSRTLSPAADALAAGSARATAAATATRSTVRTAVLVTGAHRADAGLLGDEPRRQLNAAALEFVQEARPQARCN